MNISERITEIKEYFKEMQVRTVNGKQVVYVIAAFPNGWVIDSSVEKSFNVTVLPLENTNEYAFCCDIEDGEEIVFDAISYCVSKMKNAIERAKLLGEKTRELKELFSDESVPVEKLKQLTFTFPDTTLPTLNAVQETIKASIEEEKKDDNNKKKEEKEVKNNE